MAFLQSLLAAKSCWRHQHRYVLEEILRVFPILIFLKNATIRKASKNEKARQKKRDFLVPFTEKKTLLQQGVHSKRAGLVSTAKALFHHVPKAGRLSPGHSQRQPLCLFLWRSSTQHSTVPSHAAAVKDGPYAHQRTRAIGVIELASPPACISREGAPHAFSLFCNKYFQVSA